MVAPSKILTVSYGTFSCTLEGFDDPFSTMKAIAEYFRDLAAGDRYFGAEPPTPDAEMLHRIAEREISRRVDAQITETGVTLRPHVETLDTPVPAEAPAAEMPASLMPASAMPLTEVEPAGISAKLARIRAAVARARAMDAEEDASPDPILPTNAAEAQAAEEAIRIEAEVRAAEEAARIEAEVRAAEEAARAAAEARAAEEAARQAAEARAAEEAARQAAEAAPVRRRVVVVQPPAPAATQTPPETPSETPSEIPIETLATAPAPRQAQSSDWDEEDALTDEDATPAQDAAISARVSQLMRGEPARDPIAEAMDQFDADDFDDEEDFDLDEIDAPQTTRTRAPAPEQAEDLAEDLDDDEDEDEDEDLDDAEPETDSEIEARVARALGETGLSAEDQAELVRELAEVERESAALRASERRGRLAAESAEASVDRLISQADNQLSGEETRRRHSTISHLKAAVVATRAEAEIDDSRDGEARSEREMARYREDLARSVRTTQPEAEPGLPRRPVRSTDQRTQRPDTRQPPLVLVSEQRIDRPVDAYETELVRPRRVNTGALAMEELLDEDEPVRAPLGRSFGDFVKPLYLTTLTELTEAAAAYIRVVEGLEEFTRPQVMRHVISTGAPMARSREDLLRAFGLLMRKGTLRRSRRGQFEISENSEFLRVAEHFNERG